MNKINFTNLPSTTTPVNATNLNLLQDNAEDAIDDVNAKVGNWGNTSAISDYTGDLNDLTVSGLYVTGTTNTNPPTNEPYYVLVMTKNPDYYIKQIAFKRGNGVIYERQKDNGVWSSWLKIADGRILWTNLYPSSNFSAQNITLSSSEYNYLEWYFIDGSHSYCYKVPKGYGFKATVLVGEGANTYLGFRYRIMTYTDDTHYAVGSGNIKSVNKNNPETGTYDGVVKPLYVIGY